MHIDRSSPTRMKRGVGYHTDIYTGVIQIGMYHTGVIGIGALSWHSCGACEQSVYRHIRAMFTMPMSTKVVTE